jgi:hypothetical protein
MVLEDMPHLGNTVSYVGNKAKCAHSPNRPTTGNEDICCVFVGGRGVIYLATRLALVDVAIDVVFRKPGRHIV